jgi:hypothetical protein
MRTPLDAALLYAARGWAVLPCHQATGHSCGCGQRDCPSPAKHPRTRRGLHDATTDPERIRRWWQKWPSANVAVRTGSESGVIVLDVDVDRGGLGALFNLQRRYGALPPSRAVRTGSGGRHYWFAHPGSPVRNSAGRLGPGLDIRGDGGYVISPPSIHAAGGRYLWVSEVELAPAPAWLLDACRQPEPPPPAGVAHALLGRDVGAWARAALDGELTRVRESTEGFRNHSLNRAAFALGQLVAAGHLAENPVREALVAGGAQVGLHPREVRATVASGLRAGSRSPRWPSSTAATDRVPGSNWNDGKPSWRSRGPIAAIR